MFRLLHYLFPRAYRRAIFNSQPNSIDPANLAFAFTDSGGNAYSRFIDPFKIPVSRWRELQSVLMQVELGLSHADRKQIAEGMHKAMNRMDEKGRMSPDMGFICHGIIVLKTTEENSLSPDLLFEAAALLSIRKDENPARIDAQLQAEKVAQFKKDADAGLYDQLFSSGLSYFFPMLEELAEELPHLMEIGAARRRALITQMQDYILNNTPA